MSINKFLIWLNIFMLTGCSWTELSSPTDSGKVATLFNQDIFNHGGKAVVVISEKNDIPSAIKLHGVLTFADSSGTAHNLEINRTSVFMLDPDSYFLQKFELKGDSGYFSAKIDYGNRYKCQLNLTQGDVLYLGNIRTQTLLSKDMIEETDQKRQELVTDTSIQDDFDELSADFKEYVYRQTGHQLTPAILNWKDTGRRNKL